jgi:hypothetical protein
LEKFTKQFLEACKLDHSERMAILDVHNKLRNFVAMGRVDGQPPAKNMQQLVRLFVGIFLNFYV